jgi:hypothetical protein
MDAARLRMPFLVQGVYAVIVGVILFFPALATAVFAYPMKDAALSSGWGAALVSLGLVALVAASDAAKYAGLAWAFCVTLLLSAVDIGYFWYAGAFGARQALLPVVLNIALAAWVWLARPRMA